MKIFFKILLLIFLLPKALNAQPDYLIKDTVSTLSIGFNVTPSFTDLYKNGKRNTFNLVEPDYKFEINPGYSLGFFLGKQINHFSLRVGFNYNHIDYIIKHNDYYQFTTNGNSWFELDTANYSIHCSAVNSYINASYAIGQKPQIYFLAGLYFQNILSDNRKGEINIDSANVKFVVKDNYIRNDVVNTFGAFAGIGTTIAFNKNSLSIEIKVGKSFNNVLAEQSNIKEYFMCLNLIYSIQLMKPEKSL